MMKTWKKLIFVAVIAIFSIVACDDDPPKEHTGTITAWDRTITVKGNASISATDFTNAKTKLENAMVDLDEHLPVELKVNYTIMLNRTGFAIIIETGNTSPNANANKQMTVGVNYLLNNDATPTIATAINVKVNVENAFAD